MKRSAGQTATEYMLILSVIVCALVASAYLFIPEFQGGVAALAKDVSVALATGQVGGIGFARGAGGGVGNNGNGGVPQPPGATMAGPSVGGANSLNSPSQGTSISMGPANGLGNSPAPSQGPGHGVGTGPSVAAHILSSGPHPSAGATVGTTGQ